MARLNIRLHVGCIALFVAGFFILILVYSFMLSEYLVSKNVSEIYKKYDPKLRKIEIKANAISLDIAAIKEDLKTLIKRPKNNVCVNINPLDFKVTSHDNEKIRCFGLKVEVIKE